MAALLFSAMDGEVSPLTTGASLMSVTLTTTLIVSSMTSSGSSFWSALSLTDTVTR